VAFLAVALTGAHKMKDEMDEKERRSAFASAITTEHFVLQTAISTTINEGASRASIYVFSLSSSLVAMGFATQSPEAFMPFVTTVLPAVFLMGVFTVLRLVDIAAENMQAHIGIARIRGYYRTLGAEAEVHFASHIGRWPEARTEPSLRIGPLIGYLTTTAIMIAFVNAIVAAAGITLLAHRLSDIGIVMALLIGTACAASLLLLFFFYQRYRINELARLPGARDEKAA
jgi:hypothetical protein